MFNLWRQRKEYIEENNSSDKAQEEWSFQRKSQGRAYNLAREGSKANPLKILRNPSLEGNLCSDRRVKLHKSSYMLLGEIWTVKLYI
jgi:hypothetical protein